MIRGTLKLKGRGGITKQTKTTSQHGKFEKAMNSQTGKIVHVEKTAAEAKYEAKTMQIKKDLIKQKAEKSYREKINEFNEKIAKLSEYNDIPKV